MANQLVSCPHCGGSGWAKGPSTGRRGRPGRSKTQTFETTAAALSTSLGSNGFRPAPNGFRPRPIEQGFDPIDQATLSPGAHSESRAYRQRSASDIWIPLLTNLASSGVAMISSAMVAGVIRAMLIPQDWPGWIVWVRVPQLWIGKKWWAFALLAFVGTMGYLWFKRQLPDLLDDDKLVTAVQEHDRPFGPAPINVEGPSADIVINSGTTQTRAKLWAPKTNHAGLWQYADALVRETAAPSYEGGEHVLGAKTYGYTPAEFDGRSDCWRPTAIAGGILEKDPEKSRGYRLTDPGRRALGVIVKRRLGEWG